MKNWEKYQSAYEQADQATKSKLHSSLIPECVDAAIVKYELDQSHKRIMVQMFANKTVGITDENSTIEAMRSAGIPAAGIVAKEIIQCIYTKTPTVPDTSLVDEQPAIPSETSKLVAINQQTQTSAATPTPQPTATADVLADELAEAEAAFHNLQPIRTMAGDMQSIRHNEPTHQATGQDALLQGRGNQEKNPDARWGAGQ